MPCSSVPRHCHIRPSQAVTRYLDCDVGKPSTNQLDVVYMLDCQFVSVSRNVWLLVAYLETAHREKNKRNNISLHGNAIRIKEVCLDIRYPEPC